nr:glycosyltransferase family 2 protein [Cohnella abietis]
MSICTRNRHEDLERCIHSISMQNPQFPVEVLIVDDGEIPETLLTDFEIILSNPNFELHYYKKQIPGLIHSRVETIRLAKHEVILFLDDDVELASGYLDRLMDLYNRYPDAAGVGGRDVLLGTSFIWRMFCKVFLYGSNKPGKLSLSGYGGSMTLWCLMKEPFQTEYLVGCNMSFRRGALLDLQPVPWLIGYSVGEDLYLTQVARCYGQVWLDPDLKVIHHQSSQSRDKVKQVAYSDIVNHYYLLRENGSAFWRYICLLWTSIGLLIRSMLRKAHRPKRSGYWSGLKFVITRYRGRFTHETVVNHGKEQTYR